MRWPCPCSHNLALTNQRHLCELYQVDINTISLISINWSKLVNCVLAVKSVKTGITANTGKIVKTILTVITDKTVKIVKSVKTALTGEWFVKTIQHLVFSFNAIPMSLGTYTVVREPACYNIQTKQTGGRKPTTATKGAIYRSFGVDEQPPSMNDSVYYFTWSNAALRWRQVVI